MKKGTIYALRDPRDNSIRYIGQSINVKARYVHHLNTARNEWYNKGPHSIKWIRSLLKLRLKPILEIIEDDIEIEYIDEKEIYYIDYYKSQGCNLCNHSAGGKGMRGDNFSDDAKLRKEAKKLLSEKEKIEFDQKAILCIKKSGEIEKTFRSIKSAAKHYKFDERIIKKICLGKHDSDNIDNIRFIAV